MHRVPDFFARLDAHGDRIALFDGERTWSYDELLDQARAWTDQLDRWSARRVAYRLGNGRRWIALDLALLRSGRVAVPIPDFFSPVQEAHALATSGADLYVVDDLDRCAPGFTDAETWQDCTVLHRVIDRPSELHPGTAKITYTSGTTGSPKGVCLSAAQLLNTANAIQLALGEAGIERHLSVLPLPLLLENVAGVYASLGNGSSIGVPPLTAVGLSGSSGLDPARFIGALNEYRPHSLILVPQLLLAMTLAAEFGLAIPDSFRFVAVGGGKVAPTLLARARAAGIPAYEGYGLTECGSVVTLNVPGANRPGTVGRPLAHVNVGIVDGEIRVLENTMLGYLGGPRAGRCIATGDLGQVDVDGFVHVSGRRKNGFVTAFGRNVSPEWIESELTSEFSIAQAVVFGDGLSENLALIVPRGNAASDALDDAVASANGRLPDYARVGAWRPVDVAEFTAAGCLTDNGRPRRDIVERAFAHLLESMLDNLEERSDAAIRRARGANP